MYDAAFQLAILATFVSHITNTGIKLFPSYKSRPSALSLSKPHHLVSPGSPAAAAKPLSSPPVVLDAHHDHHPDTVFRAFQSNYLLVFLLAVAADWIQGPYIYALYSHYGYDKNNIARLYIAGFASSAVFGTFVAAVADKYGRRCNALLYCLCYSLSCATKHSSNFHVLLLGRVLGGVAYSILFSAFEAWMVYEHHARAFDPARLASTFARAQFGNGIVAIAAGQTAGWCEKQYGKVIPFDISIAILTILAIVIATTWRENYGDATPSVRDTFARAVRTLAADRKILLLGVAQSAFEGAMYTFTFVWTPALQTAAGQRAEIPHGTIFSTFMACTMVGSNVFAILSRRMRPESLMRAVFCMAAVLFVAATLSKSVSVTYGVFLLFEVLCGMYFPGMATARAPYIPEESRSALLTFFRVPLNIIVVVALYEDMDVRSVFKLCAGLMVVAACSLHWLLVIAARESDMPLGAGGGKQALDDSSEDIAGDV